MFTGSCSAVRGALIGWSSRAMSSAVCSLRLKVSASEIMASAVQTAPLQSNRLHANPAWSNRIRPWYPEQQLRRSVHLCDLRGSLSLEHLFISNRNTMKDFVPLHWRLREKLFFILTLKLCLSLEQRNKLIWLNLDFLAQTDRQESGNIQRCRRRGENCVHLIPLLSLTHPDF